MEYGNNTEPGVAWVKVTGNPDAGYTGHLAANFNVVLGQVDISEADVAPIAEQTFTGKPLEPRVSVSYLGQELMEGEDYVVTYSGNVRVGTATATVEGRGRYTGSVQATFGIAAPARSGSLNAGIGMSDVKYQLEAGFDEADPPDSTSIRFISGIDGLGYQSVGLLFSATASSDSGLAIGAPGVSSYTNRSVYSSILESGAQRTAHDVYGDAGYEYLAAVKVVNVPRAAYNRDMYVRAFAIKADGTVVYGPVRSFTVVTKELGVGEDDDAGYGDLH